MFKNWQEIFKCFDQDEIKELIKKIINIELTKY